MPVEPDLLTVSQVCRQLPGARGARNVTPSTVTRWILAGCPARDGTRVRLAAIRVGSRWLVRPADLDAFFAALAVEPAPTRPIQSSAARNRAAEIAGRELEEMGA